MRPERLRALPALPAPLGTRHCARPCNLSFGQLAGGLGAKLDEQAGAGLIYSGVSDPMPTGYRLILAALGGLLLFMTFGYGYMLAALNYPEQERYQTYRYAADKPQEVDPTLPRPATAKPLEYRAACDEPKGRDESDLCAQWKAARAAEASALWAKASFWLGLAGTLGLVATLWFNYRFLRMTQDSGRDAEEALKIATRNADAATAQVALTEETAKRQLRAYITCDTVETNAGLFEDNGALGAYEFVLHWKNSGATPASHLVCHIGRFESIDGIPRDFGYDLTPAFASEQKTVGSGGVATIKTRLILREMHKSDYVAPYIYSWVEYTDIFKQRRRSEVCFIVLMPPNPTADSYPTVINFGPFNGIDESCHMPVRTGGPHVS